MSRLTLYIIDIIVGHVPLNPNHTSLNPMKPKSFSSFSDRCHKSSPNIFRLSGWANGLDGNCRPRSSSIFPACRRLLLSWKRWKGQSGSIAVRCLADLQKWARSYRPRRFHHFFLGRFVFFGSWLSLPAISPMGCPKFDHSNASNVLILLGETFGGSKLMCEKQTL